MGRPVLQWNQLFRILVMVLVLMPPSGFSISSTTKVEETNNVVVSEMPDDDDPPSSMKCGECPCTNPCSQPQLPPILPLPLPSPSPTSPPPPPPPQPSPPPPPPKEDVPYCSVCNNPPKKQSPPPPRFIYVTGSPPAREEPYSLVIYANAARSVLARFVLVVGYGVLGMLLF